MKRWRWMGLAGLGAFLACFFLWELGADARPGGGHSYSGGGSSYSGGGGGYSGGSSGGGDGGGELLVLLIRLVVVYPQVGVPALVIVGGGFLWIKWQEPKYSASWSSLPVIPPPPPDLGGIRRLDPEFSVVLFEDFLYHLYAEAHRARVSPEPMALLAPHLSEGARARLLERLPEGTAIDRVVIGSMAVSHLTLPDRATTDAGEPYFVKLSVRFEANMSCVVEGKPRKYYVDETWMLARAADAKSETQEWMRARRCAKCGAVFENSASRSCASCGAVFEDARFGWLVTAITLNKQETRPASLTGYAPEIGTNDATRIHQRMHQELAALKHDDPAFTEDALILRGKLIFAELYQAWNDDELARVRPYVSDSLFNYLRYWLDAYRHEGLANWVEDYKLSHFAIAKVVRDKHYDAITVRFWASGKDYTVDANEKVVGGSKRKERYFSEYWTLIRRAHVRGAARSDKQCPNCGAQQQVSMAGQCEYCQAHITSGEFDWILSKIEQDESYRG